MTENSDINLDRSVVAESFLLSNEFKEIYGENISNERFIQILNTNVFGRVADTEDLDYLVSQLSSGVETRYEILLGFAESTEVKTLQSESDASNDETAWISRLHFAAFGDFPNTDELQYWINKNTGDEEGANASDTSKLLKITGPSGVEGSSRSSDIKITEGTTEIYTFTSNKTVAWSI